MNTVEAHTPRAWSKSPLPTLIWPTLTWPTLIGALALLGSCAGWWIDRPMFFAAWLSAWWFCLGLVLGAAANSQIHVLTGGRWGVVLAPATAALQRSMPWLLLLALPMLAGIRVIYPWSATPDTWAAAITHPEFQRMWFAPAFFGLRLACYGAAWWAMSRLRSRKAGHAALALIGYTLLTSLAAVDLLMSLTPGWTSSVFGWLVLIGQMTTGAAAATALAAMSHPFVAAQRGSESAPVWRDLGNLLLMYVMLQAYLHFMQFLIIWAENLPREISWYVPRLQTGWWMVGIALVALQFVLPLLALLWRRNKDDPRRLVIVCLCIVFAEALCTAWLIVPSVQAQQSASGSSAAASFDAWWFLPLAMAGMALLLFGHLPAALKRAATVEAPSGTQ